MSDYQGALTGPEIDDLINKVGIEVLDITDYDITPDDDGLQQPYTIEGIFSKMMGLKDKKPVFVRDGYYLR